MSIRVICSECQSELEVSEAAAGKKGRCPTCQAVMEIPRAADPGGLRVAPSGGVIFVHCLKCGLQLEVSAASAGRKGRCPQCRELMSIPRVDERDLVHDGAQDSLVVTCQKCNTQLQVSASAAGKMGRCPQCRGVMPIPAAEEGAQETMTPVPQPEGRPVELDRIESMRHLSAPATEPPVEQLASPPLKPSSPPPVPRSAGKPKALPPVVIPPPVIRALLESAPRPPGETPSGLPAADDPSSGASGT